MAASIVRAHHITSVGIVYTSYKIYQDAVTITYKYHTACDKFLP